jgi:hypothetical protein
MTARREPEQIVPPPSGGPVTPTTPQLVRIRDQEPVDYLFARMRISPAQAIAHIFEVCFPDVPDAGLVLDASYGKGRWWSPKYPVPVTVIGLDKNPRRAKDVVGDFAALPFKDASIEVGLGDPPFLSDGGRRSIMRAQYTADLRLVESEASIARLCRELWRVSRLGIVVKVQDHIHDSRLIRMSDWVRAAVPMAQYDELLVPDEQDKVIDPKWKQPQLSFYRDHSVYLIFRKDGPVHKRRRASGRTRDGAPWSRLGAGRRCAICDRPLDGYRVDAVTCSDACRQQRARARRGRR